MELDGSIQAVFVIPNSLLVRWERQARTNYQKLPESEKQSDREEADKMLAIIRANEPPLWHKMGYDEQSVAQGDTE